jgi:glycerol-3-phosphate O-acyltransferase
MTGVLASRDALVAEANRKQQLPVPEFALKNRNEVIEQVLRDPSLIEFIEAETEAGNRSAGELTRTARSYASEIGPKFSPRFYYRVAHFLAGNWLRLHYTLSTVASDTRGMRGIAPIATVIFVSNHRSNFDPLVLTSQALPYATVGLSAGEWARLWPLHHFVRAAGGFVVDRDSTDTLYRRVLASYVQLYVASGVHQGFFPEGELSRDGKMSVPKLGFLNFYCRACSDDRDIVFVPTGINYDRIPEDWRLAHAEGSFENPRATFVIGSSLRYLASVLALPFRRRSRRYGHACVAFGTPVSLRDWLAAQNIEPAELASPGRYAWLPALAADLMAACASQVPATPATLLAAVICGDAREGGWTIDELKRALKELTARLESANANIHLPEGPDAGAEFALDLLVSKGLVQRDKSDRYVAVRSRLPVLRHYANSVGHLGT